MNPLAYILYLFITYLITVHVGLVFYRNGRGYILLLLASDGRLTDFINKMLLTGYYLLNLGYVALILHSWKTLVSWTDVLLTVSYMTGRIMVTLSVIHFFNMAVILLIGRQRHRFIHYKN